jgi:hypothetical protein
VIGFTAAPMGSGTVATHFIRCTAAGVCTDAPDTVGIAGLGGGVGDPLLTADHLGGPTFFLAGIGEGAGRRGLSASVLDVDEPGGPVANSVLVPLDHAAEAVDMDVSTVTTMTPTSFTVTIGYAISTPTGIDFGAFRVCS